MKQVETTEFSVTQPQQQCVSENAPEGRVENEIKASTLELHYGRMFTLERLRID